MVCATVAVCLSSMSFVVVLLCLQLDDLVDVVLGLLQVLNAAFVPQAEQVHDLHYNQHMFYQRHSAHL